MRSITNQLRAIILNRFPEARESSDLLRFLVQLLSRKLNDPASTFFLPHLIQQQRAPTYDPYEVNSWSISNIIDGMSGTFTKLKITGLSNASVQGLPTVSDNNVISGDGVFLKALKQPASIHITGTATLIQNDNGQRLSGAFSADLTEATVRVQIQLGDHGDQIQADVQEIRLHPPDKLTDIMMVSVNIDPHYDKFLNARINQNHKLKLIYEKIQGELTSPQTLHSFSELITKAINHIA
ncbi:hypothetical protein [Paenibacillus massiliensis]|uniref:hypothetical protein n=1 Tax=Paenibacillus massiliensis TaxID=225917 RepID=UPI00046F6E4B|nr:hypothetical protein [Paenibacillus massiliensis]